MTSSIKVLKARSRFLGTRIVAGEGVPNIGLAPARIDTGPGVALLFRFGAVVTIGTSDEQERSLLARIAPCVRDAFPTPETEEALLHINPSHSEGVDANGQINLRTDSEERLAQRMREGDMPGGDKDLLQQIGDTLLTEVRTVGRVEVTEKPEVTWDHPEVDGLYMRLAAEFELVERDRALSRKLALISSVAERCLDLLNTRRALRVEWYIVALIVFELVVGLVQLWRS